MSLNDPQVVDFLGTRPDERAVVLTVVDDWDWTDEMRHLRALQRKLDAYFAFIASGELLAAYPDAVGKDVVIDLIARLPIPKAGTRAARGGIGGRRRPAGAAHLSGRRPTSASARPTLN